MNIHLHKQLVRQLTNDAVLHQHVNIYYLPDLRKYKCVPVISGDTLEEYSYYTEDLYDASIKAKIMLAAINKTYLTEAEVQS